MPSGPTPAPPGHSARPDKQKQGWRIAVPGGWQHSKKPQAPRGLTDIGQKAWRTWLGAWWASFYSPDDLPALEMAVSFYDKAMAGDDKAAGRFLPLADKLGLTPYGRNQLRWWPPEGEEQAKDADPVSDDLAARRARRDAAVS